MFPGRVPLAALLVLPVGVGALDVLFVKGVGVLRGPGPPLGRGGRQQVLVPPRPVHLQPLLRHLQGPQGARHHPGDGGGGRKEGGEGWKGKGVGGGRKREWEREIGKERGEEREGEMGRERADGGERGRERVRSVIG